MQNESPPSKNLSRKLITREKNLLLNLHSHLENHKRNSSIKQCFRESQELKTGYKDPQYIKLGVGLFKRYVTNLTGVVPAFNHLVLAGRSYKI